MITSTITCKFYCQLQPVVDSILWFGEHGAWRGRGGDLENNLFFFGKTPSAQPLVPIECHINAQQQKMSVPSMGGAIRPSRTPSLSHCLEIHWGGTGPWTPGSATDCKIRWNLESWLNKITNTKCSNKSNYNFDKRLELPILSYCYHNLDVRH